MKKYTKGYTLIELLVTVAIASAIMGIGVPSYMRYKTKSYRGEAMQHLAAIHGAQTNFLHEMGSYANNINRSDFDYDRPTGHTYYKYKICDKTDAVGDGTKYEGAAATTFFGDSMATCNAPTSNQYIAYASGNIDTDSDPDQIAVCETGSICDKDTADSNCDAMGPSTALNHSNLKSDL